MCCLRRCQVACPANCWTSQAAAVLGNLGKARRTSSSEHQPLALSADTRRRVQTRGATRGARSVVPFIAQERAEPFGLRHRFTPHSGVRRSDLAHPDRGVAKGLIWWLRASPTNLRPAPDACSARSGARRGPAVNLRWDVGNTSHYTVRNDPFPRSRRVQLLKRAGARRLCRRPTPGHILGPGHLHRIEGRTLSGHLAAMRRYWNLRRYRPW